MTYNNISNYPLSMYPEANRKVDENCAQACVLNGITYPTGGYTEFIYESNKNSFGEKVGGLRIKNILSYHHLDEDPIVRSYQYNNPKDNASSNQSIFKGHSYTQGNKVIKYDSNGPYERMEIFDYYRSEPIVPLSYSGGATVFYKDVVEYYGYPDNCNGKTEYSFLHIYDDVVSYNISQCQIPTIMYTTFHPYLNYYYDDRSWARGNPVHVKTYKKSENEFSLVKSTEYTYQLLEDKKIRVGFRAFSNFYSQSRSLPYPFNDGLKKANYLFHYADVFTRTGLLKLSRTIETTCTDEGKITESTDYFYDNLKNQYEVSSIHHQRSDGSVLKKEFKYANDLKNTHSYCETMADFNILSVPIIQTDLLDNKFLKSIQTTYKRHNVQEENEMVLPQYVRVKQGNGPEETVIGYTYGDDTGNINQMLKGNYVYETIIWGYEKTLPVAKLDNISYREVSSNTVLMDNLKQLEGFNQLTQKECERLNTLNKAIRENLPDDVIVITYTYQPLMGITSQTDSQGITTYFDYDNYGHLKETYIMEGDTKKILQSYEYKYDNL